MPEPRILKGKIKAEPGAMAGRLRRGRIESPGLAEEIVVVAEAALEIPYSGPAVPAQHPVNDYGVRMSESSGPSEATSSSCGDGEGRVSDTARPSPGAEGPAELLHELSNLMTSVLLHAQMLEWKLPPYSHLKRPVREVARSAQRATELMRRLQQHTAQTTRSALMDPPPAALAQDPPAWSSSASTSSGSAVSMEDARLQIRGQFRNLTSECDTRTSDGFPKRDDSDGR